jgi:hypothetical protein
MNRMANKKDTKTKTTKTEKTKTEITKTEITETETTKTEITFTEFVNTIVEDVKEQRPKFLAFAQKGYTEHGRGGVLICPLDPADYRTPSKTKAKLSLSYLPLEKLMEHKCPSATASAHMKKYKPEKEFVLYIMSYDVDKDTPRDVDDTCSLLI